MLDTHARKYVDPIINKSAIFLLKKGFSPNSITYIAFLLGLCSSILVLFNCYVTSVIILWASGSLDAVDGAMARISNKKSAWGTILDITFDRLVELFIIFSIAYKFQKLDMLLVVLTGCIVFSMTVFLTVGALSHNNGVKSFYYQAGLAERTEGFIFFTFMIFFNGRSAVIIIIFSIFIFITAVQRIFEAHRLLTWIILINLVHPIINNKTLIWII